MKLFLLLLIACALAGCDRDREPREVHIAISLAGADAHTTAQYISGIQDAAARKNIRVSREEAIYDDELQIRQLDTLLATEPDLIAISAANLHRQDEIIKKLKDARIPVIGFNKLIPDFQYDLVVIPNYAAIGKELATLIVKSNRQDIKNIILLHGLKSGDLELLAIKNFLDTIDKHGQFTTHVLEVNYRDDGDYRSIVIPEFSERIETADAVVAVNNILTRFIFSKINLMDEHVSGHRLPLIAGIGEKEFFGKADYDNHYLVELQPYESGIRLIDATADYARGRYRHYQDTVIQLDEYIYPVLYTPHRTIHN